ncbi:MAG TPA: ThiF family adenylyltransferase [Candidatus Saccharimonadia bacterium]
MKREPEENHLSRNTGFISKTQQDKLGNSTIAIAGVGGVGGRIAVELTRLGVGHLKIADPEVFSISNLNRQEGSYQSTIGKSKADTIAKLCRDINPKIKLDLLEIGINDSNIRDFVSGSDLIIEAIDFKLPQLGIQLARLARDKKIALVMGVEIGFGATVTWFDPVGYAYERYLGLSKDINLEQFNSGNAKVNLWRWLPHIPSYGDLQVLRAVSDGSIEAPAIAPAVDLCASMTATLVLGLLVGFKVQPPAPAVLHIDVKERTSRLIRWPFLHHHATLFKALLLNALRLHDPMDLG